MICGRGLHKALVGLAILAACSREPGREAAGQGAATAVDAGAAIPAAPPAPDGSSRPAPDAPAATIPITGAFAVARGQDVPIPRDGTALVDPAAGFRVEVAAHLVDGRLALHDENDAMVASSGTTEVTSSTTRYSLTPQEPLRPGSAYQLHLDGAVTREAHDPAGRAYLPVALKLRTTGERPPPPAKKRHATRRHR